MTTMNREEQKQVLIDTANHIINRDNTSPYSENLRELARIALASLEAEPVAYIFKHPAGKLFLALTDESNKEQSDVIPVYAAPPVPVVPEEKPMPNPLSMYAVDAVAAIAEVRGWNACRAAMLQSGNFRENKNSSTNYPVIPSEVLSAIQKVAKIRADFDDFDGDRRGIGDCLDEAEQELIVTINKYASQLAVKPVVPVGLDERAAFNAWNNDENLPIAGVGAKNAAWLAWQARAELGHSLVVNYPVTPDSWISCSERMPVIGELNWRTGFPLLITCEIGVIPAYYGFVSVNGDKHYGFMESFKYGDDRGGHPKTNEYGLISNVTHWMPLPEPPQESKS